MAVSTRKCDANTKRSVGWTRSRDLKPIGHAWCQSLCPSSVEPGVKVDSAQLPRPLGPNVDR